MALISGYMEDYNGNELFENDEVFVFNGDLFLVEDLKEYVHNRWGKAECSTEDWRGVPIEFDSYYYIIDGEFVHEDELFEWANDICERRVLE